MAPTIHVSADDKSKERYQELLISEWSKDTLEATLSLLWTMIASSVTPVKAEWQKVLEYDAHGGTSGKNVNQTILTPIRQVAPFFHRKPLPKMPPVFSERKSRLVTLAEKSWTYLILPMHAPMKGDTGIFCDLQSLLFLTSVDSLLPQLKAQHLSPEHDCLVNILYIHAVFVWRDNRPDHMYYLLSVLMDYLGDLDKKLDMLHRSFSLTPKEDHSYLTKAQAVWSDLVDHDQYQEAMQFVLSVAREGPRDNVPELTQMLIEAGRVQRSRSR